MAQKQTSKQKTTKGINRTIWFQEMYRFHFDQCPLLKKTIEILLKYFYYWSNLNEHELLMAQLPHVSNVAVLNGQV